MMMPTMQLTEINGVNLELFDSGTGEPVVFIHGGGSHEGHAVIQEPALTDRFRLVYYHRRGNGQSDPTDGPITIEQQAADCCAVLEALGIERAHFVGQSYGGTVLLQYALDYPASVQSMALLEPVLPFVIGEYPDFSGMLDEAGAMYEAGDKEGAMDTFFREVCGDDYRTRFDEHLPHGWFDRLVAETDTIFQDESPALTSWSFSHEDASRVTQPVLAMMGSATRSYLRACHETVVSWIPESEQVVLPGATHAMLETNPRGASVHLADFISRHPIAR